MSFSKRLLFGNLPQDDPIREAIARSSQAASAAFTVRSHRRPRKPQRDLAGSPRDAVWEGALPEAIRELGVAYTNPNGVPHFKTAEDRDRVHELAVEKWKTRWDELERKPYRRIPTKQDSAITSTRTKPRSSVPFILSAIPPDPALTDDQLKPYLTSSSGVPELDRFNAERKWRDALTARDENAFLVPFVNWIRPAINYLAYLKTPLWEDIKEKVLTRAGGKCACCRQRATEVHHRDYRPRVLAGEDLSPLVPVCRSCHDLIEEERDKSWQRGEARLADLVNSENQRLAGTGRQS
ncbi:HNH endonuclease [Microvirga sp. VF16]|uniref:HNH endonuclease n=1 Tax=Microvirga sp. VF16 TaxID=2807101 RepID=UPI00193CF237|nr:HNH endonuclease [Microvirga sp. VF16]QRM34782.1 HNH endonuclease [Microvirga sp. VF16]